MDQLVNLERSGENNFLWPTIADAVDTFLRRRACEADSYERIWRLIHIWEAAEITLAVASLARIRTVPAQESLILKCREFFYGVSWDQVTNTFKTTQGAAKGSVDQWINILSEISKKRDSGKGFLPSLCAFLQEEALTLEPLVLAWSRACDVPPDARSQAPVSVRHAMRHINTFRNRFAHVPFPHDPLDNLAEALENVTDQFFSVTPVPWSHAKEGKSSPLTGLLRTKFQILRGTMEKRANSAVKEGILFEWPTGTSAGEAEQWEAEPFVYIDSMMRPHTLTRVNDEGTPEYTRYRAEANAVVARYDVSVHEVLPQPRPPEYMPPEEVPPEASEEEEPKEKAKPATMSDAIDAIRGERFDDAIEFFRDLTHKKPEYHIAWLRLGHAEREKALRLAEGNEEEAAALLKQAVDDLAIAAKHRDPAYEAQALYERSKAYFHLARLDCDRNANFDSAFGDAKTACDLSPDDRYQSWLDYVTNSNIAALVSRSRGQENATTAST